MVVKLFEEGDLENLALLLQGGWITSWSLSRARRARRGGNGAVLPKLSFSGSFGRFFMTSNLNSELGDKGRIGR